MEEVNSKRPVILSVASVSNYFIHRVSDSRLGVSTQAARWCSGRDLNLNLYEGKPKSAGTALSKWFGFMKNEVRDKTHLPGRGPTDEIFAQVVEKQVRLAKLLTVAALFFVTCARIGPAHHCLFHCCYWNFALATLSSGRDANFVNATIIHAVRGALRPNTLRSPRPQRPDRFRRGHCGEVEIARLGSREPLAALL